MKDEGLFGRGGKRGGGRGGVEKGGEGGCCNTATYSTEEGGAAMERERGEGSERREEAERGERGERREGGGSGCCNTVTYSTGEEPWLWMEREQIIMLL